jgi:hypothetical protein
MFANPGTVVRTQTGADCVIKQADTKLTQPPESVDGLA